MSQLNVDLIKNRTGTGGPTLSGLTVTDGVLVGGALTVTGNFTVNGTQTIVNTQVLDVADKNIGIGSTSSPSDALADGSGITIYGTTDKTLTWSNTTKNWTFVGGGLNVGAGGTIITTSSTGSIGIGSTVPQSPLHVVGNIYADGIGGNWAATTSNMIGVTTVGVTTSGITTVTLNGTSQIFSNGDYVYGSGITPGTTVSSGAGTSNITLSSTVGVSTNNNQLTIVPANKVVTAGVIAGQLCRAWVNFNGTTASPSTIRASYNVSSVTKNATGNFTITFTVAMSDTGYAAVGMVRDTTTGAEFVAEYTGGTRTASALQIRTWNYTGSGVDCNNVSIAIFR